MDNTYKTNIWALPYRVLTPLLPFAVLAGLFGIVAIETAVITPPTKQLPIATETIATSTHYNGLELEAKAAYIYDVQEKRVLFALNEEAQLPLASLTKIMTAIVASENLPDYTTIVINGNLKNGGYSGLIPGESWRLKDLLDFMLIKSSNEGASSVASAVGAVLLGFDQNASGTAYEIGKNTFVDKMNEKARELGMSQTYFLNETGLDHDEAVAGGYGSAEDITNLLAWAVQYEADLFEATRYPTLEIFSENGTSYTAVNTDPLAGTIPGLVISKTGLTDLAGGNLAIAFDMSFGHPIIVTVLGSTEKGRFDDVKKLVDATIQSFRPTE